MISRDAANTLIIDFGKTMGLEGLQLDKDNCCSLIVGKETVLHLNFNERTGEFLFVGILGHMPEDEERYAQISRFLLLSNLYYRETDGATIALEPESEIAVLQRTWSCDASGVEQLKKALESFTNLLEFWKERFENPDVDEETTIEPFGIAV